MAENNLNIKITGNPDGAVAAFNKLKTEGNTAINGLNASFNSLTSTLGGLPGIVGLVSAAMAGGAFKDSIGKFKEVGGEVLKLSKVFGVTAEEASVLRVALDDAFLTVDEAVGASDRLTRSALKNASAFEAAGISIKDEHTGALKDSLTIMMEVNDYLKSLKEGKDRDSAAMALYGKGWREFSGILKLTSEGMQEAKKRAEDLHLVFGEDKLKAIKAYKMAMKDIDDVAESLKTQIGIALLPQLTHIGVIMGDVLVKGIDPFINGIIDIEAELIRMAMLVDKAGGTLTTMGSVMAKIGWLGWGGPLAGEHGPAKLFGGVADWFDEKNGMFAKRYADNDKELEKLGNVAAGLNPDGTPRTSSKKKPGRGFDPDSLKPGIADKGTKTDSKFFSSSWDMTAEELELEAAKSTKFKTDLKYQSKDAPFSILGPGGAEAWLAQAQKDRETKRQFQQEELEFDNQLIAAEFWQKEQARQNELEATRQLEQEKQNLQMATLQNGLGLLQIFGSKNKAAALAAIAVQKGLAIGQTFISGKAAEIRALAELGPVAGPPMAATIEAWTWANIGMITATGIAEMAMKSGGGNGAASGTYANPAVVTQPTSSVPTQQQGSFVVNIHGNIIGEDKWVEENLIPAIRAAGTRNITIN